MRTIQTVLYREDFLEQIDLNDPLIKLGDKINWDKFEKEFSKYYFVNNGRPAKSIRLMVGLLILKYIENVSDEKIVIDYKRNPYYQYFCGAVKYEGEKPCNASKLSQFRKKIGAEGVRIIFTESIHIHGIENVKAETITVDTTVQEKNITYPTDSKLRIKVIKNLVKLAKKEKIKLKKTYEKEVKTLRVKVRLRNSRNKERQKEGKKSLKRLKTIGGILLRELKRKLPKPLLEKHKEPFERVAIVLKQERKDKNKIYSLHEYTTYCIAKGKEGKRFEYGKKVSIVISTETNIVLLVLIHETNIADCKTLNEIVERLPCELKEKIETITADKGYRGHEDIYVKVSKKEGKEENRKVEVVIPKAPLKEDDEKERKRKSYLCKQRSAIEPVIGHLKSDHRLNRNLLKGSLGDITNLLLASAAWNFKKWLRGAIFFMPMWKYLNIRKRFFLTKIIS